MTRAIPLLLSASTLWGAVANLRVDEVTNTQGIIRYTAPTDAACTLEVSESGGYTPVVHDDNATLFSGANSDARAGAITNGRERIFPVGTRKLEQATDGRYYSRALQADTIHYVRVTCGGDQATTTFRTATIPLGATYTDLFPANSAGDPIYPFVDYSDRSVSIIDPSTGVLVKQFAGARDGAGAPEVFAGGYLAQNFGSASGTNWTSASEALTANATYASYSGASCGGTCDWLLMTKTTSASYPYQYYSVDALQLHILGYGDDASGLNRTIEACFTQDGSTCDSDGVTLTAVLPQSTPGTVTLGVETPIYTWRAAGKTNITGDQLRAGLNLRWLIRKTTSTGNIYVDRAYYDLHVSAQHTTGTGGSFERCSTIADGNGWYKCTTYWGGISTVMFAVNGDTGEVRHLGWLLLNSNQQCQADSAVFSATDPNKYYCITSNGLLEITLDSNNTEVSATSYASKSEVVLAANPTTSIANFVTANSGEYSVPFSNFGCGLAASSGQYLHFSCLRGAQDTYGWAAVWDTGTSAVIAAAPIYNGKGGRWCVNHALDPSGDMRVLVMNVKNMSGAVGAGYGKYTTTLSADVTTTTQTNFTVSGEPTSTNDDVSLQNAAVGDVFAVGSELVRITDKSGNDWTVSRGEFSTTKSTYSSGATLTAVCANSAGPSFYNGSIGDQTFNTTWRFLDDPYGNDTTGTYLWGNPYYNHVTARGNVLAGAGRRVYNPSVTRILHEVQAPAWTATEESTSFAGKTQLSSGASHASHPTYHGINSTAAMGKFSMDSKPFLGGNLFSPTTEGCTPTNDPYPAAGGCALARVSGTTHVYRYIPATAYADVNPKHSPISAVAGKKILTDLSGPSSSISDANNAHWCYAANANECVSGSSAGNIYVSSDTITTYYCAGTFGVTTDACVANLSANSMGSFQWDVTTGKWRWSRLLARNGLGMMPRNGNVSQYSTAKALANGKWALADRYILERRGVALLKIPRVSWDSVDRSKFLPVSLQIGSVPLGTNNVVAEFGYAENGSPTNFYCTTRAEKCLATGSTLSQSDPFTWPSEDGGETSVTGLSCAAGCTLTIPAISGRMLYYRVLFRNASNATIATGGVRVQAIQ